MKAKNKKIYTEREDDYSMLSLWPGEVRAEAEKICKEALDFSEKHKNDMYVFKDFSKILGELRLSYKDVIQLLPPFLKQYDEYYYYDKKVDNNLAFGVDYFCKIIIRTKEGFIINLNLAFDVGAKDNINLLIEFLMTLGRKYNLILIDMYLARVVDLSDKKSVEKYISDRINWLNEIQERIDSITKKEN